MTPLRQRMVEDMKIRHFSPETRYRYILAVEKFAQHFGRSPEHLGRERVREFLVYIHETGASYHVLSSYVSALRFLFRITLRKPWTAEDIPFPRQRKHLPSIPTREEVLRLLRSISNISHRAVLTTCFAAGLRVSTSRPWACPSVDRRFGADNRNTDHQPHGVAGVRTETASR